VLIIKRIKLIHGQLLIAVRQRINQGGKVKFLIIPIILLVVSTVSLAAKTQGQREVLLDNSAVEVVRLTYPVGTDSGVHTHIHPNRVVYFVKGGKLELVPEDNKKQSTIIDVSDGDTLFLPATTHNVKNIGNTEVVIVETEIKSS
jgi:mannose-6-phosphate isomerase-like protein (cupin superfamily)